MDTYEFFSLFFNMQVLVLDEHVHINMKMWFYLTQSPLSLIVKIIEKLEVLI